MNNKHYRFFSYGLRVCLAGFSGLRDKEFGKLFMKIGMIAVILMFSLSQISWAIDPRQLIQDSKSFFASVEEERSSRRSAQNLESLEAGQQSFIDQQNALQDLVAYNRFQTDGNVDGADYTIWADQYGQTGPDLAGDFNHDGQVDAADYTIWADNYDKVSIPSDANGDGNVDGADYTVWADQYGRTGPDLAADFNHDGKVDGTDYMVWADHYDPPEVSISDHADFSDVRGLESVKVESEAPVLTYYYMDKILNSQFTVYDKEHPFAQELQSLAKEHYVDVAYGLLRDVLRAIDTGNYTSWSGPQPHYEDLLPPDASSLLSKKLAYNFTVWELTKGLSSSYFSPYSEPITPFAVSLKQAVDPIDTVQAARGSFWAAWYTNFFTQKLNIIAPVEDYERALASGSGQNTSTFALFNRYYIPPSLDFNSYRQEAEMAGNEFMQNMNYRPYADIWSSFANVTSNDPEARFGDLAHQLAQEAANSAYRYADKISEAKQTFDSSSRDAAALLDYKNALKSANATYADFLFYLADQYYQALAPQIENDDFEIEVETKAGLVSLSDYHVRESSAVSAWTTHSFQDPQGNSLYTAPGTAPGSTVILDVDVDIFNRERSSLLDAYYSANLWYHWYREPGVVVDDIYADYSRLSDGLIVVIKTVETDKPTHWQFLDRLTGAVVLSVEVAGSEVLNRHPVGIMNQTIRSSERYENGKLVRVDIENLTDGSRVVVLKREGKDDIIYDADSGLFQDAVIANDAYLENPDRGFKITMKDGLVDEVYLGDNSLYGSFNKIFGGQNSAPALSRYNINRMIQDANKYPAFLPLSESFQNGIGILNTTAPHTNLQGELSLLDFTFVTPSSETEDKTRVQAGIYYADKGNAPSIDDKFTSARISFSPSPISNIPDPELLVLSGDVGKEVTLLKNSLLEIPQEYGLFGNLQGRIENLATPQVNVKVGTFTKAASQDNALGSFDTTTFVEKGTDGKLWVGLKWTYITAASLFLKGEFKTRLIGSEEVSAKVTNGSQIYLLGKLLTGVFLGREEKALSSSQMDSVKEFLMSKVLSGINFLSSVADNAVRSAIDQFDRFIKPRLDNIYHNHLHAAPILAHRLEVSGSNGLGMASLQNSIQSLYYNLSQVPLEIGEGFAPQLMERFLGQF